MTPPRRPTLHSVPNDHPDVLAAFGAPVPEGPLQPSAVLRAAGARGPRIPTGLGTLDTACRGGLCAGSLWVFGGAPGAGKTTLLCQLALYRLAAGDHVVLLAADESPQGLALRLGQLLGYDRNALESGDTTDAEAALDAYGDRLWILDGAEWTVEAAALLLPPGGVLLVDSIQTLRAAGTEGAEPRARVDAVVHALKSATRIGLLVLATCELARGAYRSNDPTQRINSLAAFKESGSVEYGMDGALVLRTISGEPDLVDVEVVKNRLGSRPEFRLRLDRARALLSEVPRPNAPDLEAARDGAARARLSALEERILATVRAYPALTSANAIARTVGPGRRSAVLDAIAGLLEQGRLEQRPGGWRVAVPNGRSSQP
jgi:KaiC/GvpD/RAD55 family RecA-like ATPase